MKIYVHFLFICGLLLHSVSGIKAEIKEYPINTCNTETYDSISSTLKLPTNHLDEKKWDTIASGLNYAEEIKEETTTTPPDLSFLGPLIQIIGFILVLAILAFIIAKIIPVILKRNKSVNQTLHITVNDALINEDNIDEWPLQKMLDEYLKENDFRNSIRIYYLKTLQLLHLNGHILWKADKTNSHYITEFFNHTRSSDFINLTRIYETIWYGQLVPDEQMFSVARNQFESFNAQFPIK
jgi:hypothetical protein